MKTFSRCSLLMAGAALAALSTTAVAADNAGAGAIEEVVVTANRRTDTVHNVPMSVEALTSAAIEAQGLKTAQDLARAVPALRISPISGSLTAAAFGSDVAIRGITSSSGSPTTGVYIDDVPIQVRRLSGATGGGVVFPQLFDLQRVEVLRGPQGTLYGASSQGGTIRFITKQPSFSEKSGYVRGEASSTEHGDPSFEIGGSVGGPILEDRLAFNLTAWTRHEGGYIDHLSRFTGKPVAKDTNDADHRLVHAQLAWKPAERATITLSYLYSENRQKDSDQYWLDVPRLTSTSGPAGRVTTTNYGPYKYGPYTSGYNLNIGDKFYTSDSQVEARRWPHKDFMRLPSATFDYDFDKVAVKLVSSLLEVHNTTQPNYSMSTPVARGGTALSGGFNALPDASPFIANMPVLDAPSLMNSRIQSHTEELRFSSNNSESRLSWVAGAYYNKTRISSYADQRLNLADFTNATALGLSTVSPIIFGFSQTQAMEEIQVAAFGEATFSITEKLKATAGARESRDKFKYKLINAGPIFGITGPPVVAVDSGIAESSFTPKFGLQYIINSNNNLYANASKGFRAGGVNPTVNPICGPALIAAGFPNGAPTTLKSDSLWSYEAGAKMRGLGGRATLNASVFRTDWKNVQTNILLTCGSNFNANAAKVRSQGFDLEGSINVLDGLTLSGSVAYTDAQYKGTVRSSPTTVLIADGDLLPYTPKWSGNIGALYNFELASRQAYVRADYQFRSGVVQTLGPTTISYGPDMYRLSGTNYVTARAGLKLNEQIDLSVFVDNLTASKDELSTSGLANILGRNNCLNGPACTSFVKNAPVGTAITFRPRTWGLAASYRY